MIAGICPVPVNPCVSEQGDCYVSLSCADKRAVESLQDDRQSARSRIWWRVASGKSAGLHESIQCIQSRKTGFSELLRQERISCQMKLVGNSPGVHNQLQATAAACEQNMMLLMPCSQDRHVTGKRIEIDPS